jgi:radical SAM superfamily enzyme YgiQ (UPF0313 family)
MKDITLVTINAKWIHPSLALRLLKANLGVLESRCEIIEFALRQPLSEKTEPLLAVRPDANPRILGISVSIWNHLATIELLEELEKSWAARDGQKPVVVLGGPEVSHLPESAAIFRHADYVIRGEGEIAFKELCEKVLANPLQEGTPLQEKFINAKDVDVTKIKTAYHLYTDEDVEKKLIYVEASRGCPFNCEFCLSSVSKHSSSLCDLRAFVPLCEFPLEFFFSEMSALITRGVKTFKFLDRTFNTNIKRAIKIMELFLERGGGTTVHFEMVPSLFTPELFETLSRFPPHTLRLEIGIQTLNAQVAARIKRPSQPEKELEVLRLLREKTNAIIHADLIAGLPGEDYASFGRGFDLLWRAVSGANVEIQVGILKLLPGAPIARHNWEFAMCYSSEPPYEVRETSAMSAEELSRIKNFARFWEMIVNRGLAPQISVDFNKFMALSDALLAHFGRNWGIDRDELLETVNKLQNITRI